VPLKSFWFYVPPLPRKGPDHEDFGRPTSYKPRTYTAAKNYCLLAPPNAELAEFFGVAAEHHRQRRGSGAEFAARSVHKGRAFADAKVARGLMRSAFGFQHKVEAQRALSRRGEANHQHGAYQPDSRPASLAEHKAAAELAGSAKTPDYRASEDAQTSPCSTLPATRARRDRAKNSDFSCIDRSAEARSGRRDLTSRSAAYS